MKLISLSLLLALVAVAASEKARFDNYRVYEISIGSEEQLDLLKQIESFPDGYRFWEFPAQVGKNAELMVPPHKFGEFSELVEKFELKTRVMISNVQQVMDDEQPEKRMDDEMGEGISAFNWNAYWTYAQFNTWFDSMVSEHAGKVTHVTVGTSYEGRAIRGIKINIGGGVKKSVVFEGTIHAREWVSAATISWMANELLTSTDPEVQAMASGYEWIFLPVTNPDGYAYTHERDRSWRKTRRPSSAICFGADPNRNWDNHFNEGGSSTNPCSDTYAGSAPFSEPETKQLSDYLKTIPQLTGYFAFHAYGQMMMTPYGWTTQLLGNYQQLYEIGQKGVAALTAKYNTQYKLGSIANVIYIASGSSIDWVKDTIGAPLTYAYEFRDLGRYGFSLPADQIIPNSVEVFASIIAIMKEAKVRGIA